MLNGEKLQNYDNAIGLVMNQPCEELLKLGLCWKLGTFPDLRRMIAQMSRCTRRFCQPIDIINSRQRYGFRLGNVRLIFSRLILEMIPELPYFDRRNK
jgi:hypothetical protein